MPVVQLHDTAAAAARATTLPKGAIAGQIEDVTAKLSEIRRNLKSTPAGPYAQLGQAIDSYRALAGLYLGNALPNAAAAAAQFRTTDATWTAALRAIGSANHVNMLAGLPPLLLPSIAAPSPNA